MVAKCSCLGGFVKTLFVILKECDTLTVLAEVAATVRPMVEILDMSLHCWKKMPKKVHQSAWVVCGYVEPSHFTQFPDSPQIGSQQEAEQTLDPAQVLGGSAIQSTPQWCTQFEWQIKDPENATKYSTKSGC